MSSLSPDICASQKTKVDDLTKNIADTRNGVTDVKQFIDGMRTSRDTKMAELNALKTQLKENDRNDKILQLMSLAGVLIGGALGLFFKFKKVQKLANQPMLQVLLGGSGKSVITMNNPALESQSYFVYSAF